HWVFQVGLSLYSDEFAFKECGKVVVVRGEGSADVKCVLDEDKLKGMALMNLLFVRHSIIVLILCFVIMGLLNRNHYLAFGQNTNFGAIANVSFFLDANESETHSGETNVIDIRTLGGQSISFATMADSPLFSVTNESEPHVVKKFQIQLGGVKRLDSGFGYKNNGVYATRRKLVHEFELDSSQAGTSSINHSKRTRQNPHPRPAPGEETAFLVAAHVNNVNSTSSTTEVGKAAVLIRLEEKVGGNKNKEWKLWRSLEL
nr:DUF716 domain-containing protein [Tanacetum cinerariifolium]